MSAEKPSTFSMAEKAALFPVLTHQLYSATEHEVNGYASELMIDQSKLLRQVYIRLADELGKSDEMDAISWLFMGIWERISDTQLDQWAHPTETLDNSNMSFYQTAAYLFMQKQKAQAEGNAK